VSLEPTSVAPDTPAAPLRKSLRLIAIRMLLARASVYNHTMPDEN
jgi:hypothetical protein